MRLDAYTDAGDFTALRARWTELLTSSAHKTIFATPQWAETWQRSFGEGTDLCVIAVSEDEELLGIVPLYTEVEGGQTVARFLGGVDVTDYEDIIARPGAEAKVWAEALAYLDEQRWQIDLHNVPGASATVDFFRDLGEKGGRKVAIEVEDVCPLISPLPADFETYVGSLPKKARHELRRKLRRLMGDADVAAQVAWQQADLDAAMDDFVRLHKLSSPDKEEFMTPRMTGFFKSLAKMCQEQGWLCLGFLAVQGKPVSAIMAFDFGDWFGLYNSGYDPDYEYLSVGLLLKALAIEHAIKSGTKTYDFLQGNERYKYDLGGVDTQVMHIRAERR